MNVENLGKVFENFKIDSNRAILVDGPWGVGKTYQILQFLKKDPFTKDKEKNRIIYVSLFGKTTIDEIHTDIYSKLYPLKNGAKKVIQVIPKVAPLFGSVGNIISNMEFALNTDENKLNSLGKNIEKVSQNVETIANDINSVSDSKSKVRKSKNRTIVIFDDLERIDPQKMSFGDILGYINNLFLQNIKVIVICNSKEIKDENFISFKEKVFDREYKISATNDQIISSYFGDNSIYLKDYIIREFDNNLRIALRVSSFYKEAIQQLNIYNENYHEKISNETILYYCALVVAGCNSQRYAALQGKDNTKLPLIFAHSEDENIQSITQNIYNYLKKDDTGNRIFDSLIVGLLEGYYYNTYDKLIPLFVDYSKCEDPFVEDPFCLSDEEKRKLFTRQFEKIKSDQEFTNRSISDVINKMCRYEEFSDIDNRENVIIENIIEKCADSEMHFLLDFPYNECQRFTDFRKKLKRAYEREMIDQMIDNLRDSYVNKKYAKLYDLLYELDMKNVFVKNDKLNEDIINSIKENHYFIEDLFGTMELLQWEVAHKICELAMRCGFAEDVSAYIKSIDYRADMSATDRYEFLLKNKLFSES